MARRRSFRSSVIILCTIMICFSGIAGFARVKPETTRIPQTGQAPRIDGAIGEREWADARLFELAYETMPGENTPAPVRTQALIMYDTGRLYVAFRCYDAEPGQIRARYADRDRIDQDDQVALEIDTFNDGRTAYVIGSNALGVQADWHYDGTNFDATWDTIFESMGSITDSGYVVEMAIPFSSLQFQRVEGEQTWGLLLFRANPREVYRELRSVPLDRNQDCFVCQFQKVSGFIGASPGNNTELTPTVVSNYNAAREDFPAAGFSTQANDVDFGMTARWGITTNLNLLATVNPDFSQVEADALQLDINTPFALSYDEKRPFFSEGAGYFYMPVNAVYTRAIRDPRYGFKFTGKEGMNNFGAFLVRDNVTNLIFPSADRSRATSIDAENTTSVFRYNRDIWNSSTIGVLVTDREGNDYSNRVFGVDGFLRLTQVDSIQFQVLGSATRYPDAIARAFDQPLGSFNAHNIDIHYYHTARNLNVIGHFIDISDNFRADAGFIPMVGYRKMAVAWTYRWYAPQETWWSWIMIGSTTHDFEKKNGDLLLKDISATIQGAGILQTQFAAKVRNRREAFNGEEFDLTDYTVLASITPLGNLVVGSAIEFGDQIDFANTRRGSFQTYTTNATLFIGRNFQAEFYNIFERMEVDNRHLYTANISGATLVYHINSRTFARAILQYLDYSYNPDNYRFSIAASERQLATQLLLSYKLNPRTVLFLGYSDNYFNGMEFGLTKKDYTVFAKIGYALVL